MRHQKKALVLFVLLLIGVVLYLNLSSPKRASHSSPSEEFSSADAFHHLMAIAQQPRRMYQPYYYEARDYVIDELEKLGIKTELQQSTSLEPYTPIFYSSVENIVATIEGTSGHEDAVLLVAHFDSEPFVSPGAFDNAASVALLLELARVVTSSSGLQNDLVFLFSTPEEPGLQGVTAFINEHPLAKRIKMVFNFDGIVNGRFGILSTSERNSRLIGEYAKACPSSQAYSFVNTVNPYPTGDISPFKYAGYPGISFMSYFTNVRQHHSKNDNVGRISLSSLQESGDQMLALVNHFGNVDIDDKSESAGESVYFSVLSMFIVHYPASLVIPFALIVFVLSVIIVLFGSKNGVINTRHISYAVLLLVLGGIAATGIVNLVWYVITELHPMYQFLFNGFSYNNLCFYLGFVLLSFISVYVVLFIGHRIVNFNLHDLEYSVLVLLTVINLITSFVFPDIAAMLTWIILFLQALIATGLIPKHMPLTKMLVTLVYIALAVVLIVPMVMTSSMTIDTDPLRYVATVLFSIILVPVVYGILFESKSTTLSVTGLAIVALLFVPLTDGFSEASPRVTYVSSIHDADRQSSFWLVNNLYRANLDAYSSQFVKEGSKPESVRKFIPDYPYDYDAYCTPVAVDPLPPPLAEVINDSTSNGYRYLDIRIKSPRNAWEVTVFKDTALDVLEYSLDGVKCEPQFGIDYTNSDKNVLCHYRNPRKEGITLSLKMRPGGNVMLKIRDRTYGIPLKPGMIPMTVAMIPWVDRGANTTTVIKTFNF